MKVCSKCLVEQPLESFNKEVIRKDGYYPWCKSCLKEHRRVRYKKRTRKFHINNKVCSFCKRDKPRDQFGIWESSRTLRSRCLDCEEEIKKNLEDDKRRCGACRKWLELDKFFKSRRDGHHSTCVDCTKKQLEIPTIKEKRRDKSLLKYYNITLGQYRELLEKQNHTCPVCLKPLEGISNHVDHAHRGVHSGKIRAILHSRCNQMVMHNHYDAEELRRAANLIETPLTDWFVPEEFLKSRKKKRKNGKKLRDRKSRTNG